MEQAVDYGLLTLVPPLIVIAMALLTKRTIEPLIVGGVLSFVVAKGTGFIPSYLDALYFTIADNASMLVTMGLFGSLVMLFEKSKGTFGFSKIVERLANKPEKSLMTTFFLGIIVFMDDALNIMTLTSAMKGVCDRQKIPREMFAYVTASTGAPVCVLIPLSTWAIFFCRHLCGSERIAAVWRRAVHLYSCNAVCILCCNSAHCSTSYDFWHYS